MTNGSSQGLFVIVAVIIFGIFVSISYLLFENKMKIGLSNIFNDSFEHILTLPNKDGGDEIKEDDFFIDKNEIGEEKIKADISALKIVHIGENLGKLDLYKDGILRNDLYKNANWQLEKSDIVEIKKNTIVAKNKGIIRLFIHTTEGRTQPIIIRVL